MEKEIVLEKVSSVLKQLTEEEISLDSELLDDLSITSLDTLILVEKLEEEFNTKVSTTDINNAKTVNDLVELMLKS